MHLRARFTPIGDLELRAATFSSAEFNSLEHVLRKAGVPQRGRLIPFVRRASDAAGRTVRLYRVPQRIVKSLEGLLGGTFERDATFKPTGGPGKTFSCQEVNGPGCEDIFADDQDVAVVKCALIASRNLWFGGIARVGTCSTQA